MIKYVETLREAEKCDELLNKLILDERKYDNKIKEGFVVKDYFRNIFQDQRDILLIYVVDDNVVAYIYAKRICDELMEDSGYWIDGLYVEEEYRRQGIAKELMKEMKLLCSINKGSFVDINVMYKNELARRFYESLGFRNLRLTLRMDLQDS